MTRPFTKSLKPLNSKKSTRQQNSPAYGTDLFDHYGKTTRHWL